MISQLLVVTGEASGDHHAAPVVQSLQKLQPDIEVFGMGGNALRDSGMSLTVDIAQSASVMGLTEVIGSLGSIISAYKTIVNEAKKRKPSHAILVDYPDFNLRLAKVLHRMGVRVIYFISPQIWAWRSGRIHTIQKYTDAVVPIFPFEEEYYRSRGVEAHYLGHPFSDRTPITGSRQQFFSTISVDPSKKVLALLPGSRKSELERLLEPMCKAYHLVKKQNPDIHAVLPQAPTISSEWLAQYSHLTRDMSIIEGQAPQLLHHSDAAIISSGTATVEAALEQIPFTAVYKLAPLTHFVAKKLITGISHFAMPNLIAERKIVKEFLQDEVTPDALAEEATRLLFDKAYAEKMKEALGEVRHKLEYRNTENNFGKTVAERVAHLITTIS